MNVTVQRNGPVTGQVPKPNLEGYSLEACCLKLRDLAPDAYTVWKDLLDVNSWAYEGFPTDSCSVQGHPMAEEFKAFLGSYLHGTVLDIGCGPQPMPVYLGGYPPELLAGLDPLWPKQEHPFQFVQGVAEFLPWPDRSFDIVIAATSMDHVLLLDPALAEVRRVLKKTGHFIVWVSFIPGAVKYNPYRKDIKALDKYHLFHFDKPWFDQLMDKYFICRQSIRMDAESAFYSYVARL